MKTVGEAVANRLNEFLFKQGLSLYGLSKKAGMPLSTLKNLYTKHTKSPTLALIYKICDGLEVTIGEFLNSPHFGRELIDELVYND